MPNCDYKTIWKYFIDHFHIHVQFQEELFISFGPLAIKTLEIFFLNFHKKQRIMQEEQVFILFLGPNMKETALNDKMNSIQCQKCDDLWKFVDRKHSYIEQFY